MRVFPLVSFVKLWNVPDTKEKKRKILEKMHIFHPLQLIPISIVTDIWVRDHHTFSVKAFH